MTQDAEGDDDATATTSRRVRVQKRARSRFSSRRVVDQAPSFYFFFFFFFSMIVFPRLYLNLGECAREENWKTSESLQSPNAFTLPLSVDVLLLGLDDTMGNDPYMRVDKVGLLSHLNEAFGTFSVFNLNEKNGGFGEGKARKSRVNFNVQWTVKHGSVSSYEEKIGKLRRDYDDVVGSSVKLEASSSSSSSSAVPRFVVDAKELEPTVEKLIRGNNDGEIDSDGKFTVVIAMPSATRIIYNSNGTSNVDTKEFSYTYGYDLKNVDRHEELRAPKKRHRDYATSSAWVGSGKYAVVDLRAEGPPVKKGQKKSTWVFPTRHSIVEPFKEFLVTREGVFESIRSNFDAHVYGELGKTIFDGVRSLHAPDIAFETMNYAKRVLVPIIALRDHAAFDPLDPELHYEHADFKNKDVVDETANEASVDLQAIEREVRKVLLPGQELVLVSGTHELHLHHHIASAIARAKRHSVVNSEERFVKFSKRHVLEELRVSSDALGHGLSEHVERASSLLYSRYGPKAAEHAAHAMLLDTHLNEDVNFGHLHSKRGDVAPIFSGVNRTNTVKLFGTRVVPVYLLSLASYGKGVALDEDDSLEVGEMNDDDVEDDDYIRNDVASDESLVVVLQDASEISSHDAATNDSSFSSTSRKSLPNPNPTRDIIAGLAKTLGALPLPFEARKHKGQDFEPLLWAVGCHPFGGDLSNTEDVSEVIANAGRRNHIVSRLDSALHIVKAATETYNAFANEYIIENDDNKKHHESLPHSLPNRISKEMQVNMRDMNDALEELARSLSSFEENEDDVHYQSDFVLSKAMEFAERSRLTIENARIKLAQCRLRREKMSVSNSILFIPVFLESLFGGEHVFFALAVLAIVIFTISTGKRKRRKYLHHQNVGYANRNAAAAMNRAQVTSF